MSKKMSKITQLENILDEDFSEIIQEFVANKFRYNSSHHNIIFISEDNEISVEFQQNNSWTNTPGYIQIFAGNCGLDAFSELESSEDENGQIFISTEDGKIFGKENIQNYFFREYLDYYIENNQDYILEEIKDHIFEEIENLKAEGE